VRGNRVRAIVAGCATDPRSRARIPPTIQRVVALTPAKGSVFRAVAIDREVEDRILALDPEHISEADVATTLSKAPLRKSCCCTAASTPCT
jgi:hypothetical protein